MGRVVEEYADVAWVTSDNPRSEDPGGIIDEILSGVRRKRRMRVQPDRRAAIAEALQHLHISPLVTTTTRRGLQTAQKTGLNHAPAPPDFSSAVNRMLRLVSPKTLVLVELELWPNLLNSSIVCFIPFLKENFGLKPSSNIALR